MMDLREFRVAAVPRKNDKGWFEYVLEEKNARDKSKQTLVIENPDDYFSVYFLDEDWAGRTRKGPQGAEKEKSVDGLLIASFDDGTSAVLFIDLKGKMLTSDQQEHGFQQMEETIRRFAPLYRAGEAPAPTQGDQHHEAMSAIGARQRQRELPGYPLHTHTVGAVAVVNRAGMGAPPVRTKTIAGKKVVMSVVRADAVDGPNRSRISARVLCEKAQIIVSPPEPAPRKRRKAT